MVEGADHDIHLDDPQAVIAAIRDVVEAERQDSRVSDEGDPEGAAGPAGGSGQSSEPRAPSAPRRPAFPQPAGGRNRAG